MTWDGADAEGAARWVYERAGLDPTEPPGPTAVARALGIGVYTAPKRGAWGHGCLVRFAGAWQIWLAPRLPEQHRAFAVAHEIAEWAHRHRETVGSEALCDATAAAVLAPRAAFAAIIGGEPDFAALARAFRTTESCVALRIGEVTGRPMALVSPQTVRVRGDEWGWPDANAIRRMATRPTNDARAIRLGDDPKRTVILAA